MSPHRSLPRFFGIAIAAGLTFLALFASQSVRVVRESVLVRNDGWSAQPVPGGWEVARVAAGGPADGHLAPGDRIVSVNGDRRAAHVGPSWQIEGLNLGDAYALEVERAGARHIATLTARATTEPSFRLWVLIYLSTALICFAVGMMLALVKPEDPSVPMAFWSMEVLAVFLMSYSMRPIGGVRHDWVAVAVNMAFPIHLMTAYLFHENFPRPVPRAGFWKWFGRGLMAYCVWVWVIRNGLTLLHVAGPAHSLGIVDRWYPLIQAAEVGRLIQDLAFVAISLGGMFGLMRRNYRLLPDGNDRRRIRVLAVGQAIQMAPVLMVAGISAVVRAIGAGPALLRALDISGQAGNALVIIGPIAFAYAIIKHRVLGFRVFVRLGIQYLLAQNALRTVALVPMAWLVYAAVSHPDRTVGQILFAGWNKLNLAIVVLAGLGLQYRSQLSEALDRRFFRTAYDQEAILRRLVESVKHADSIAEIAGMASREIDAALHVTRVSIFYHDARAGAFSVGYSTQAEVPNMGPLSDGSPLLREISRSGAVRLADELRVHATVREAEWLDQLQAELVAPLTGIDQNVVGLLVVGAKRSEEPFTSKDKGLLRLVAVQIGSVYEVLTLRERVGRQQEIQAEVLASFDERNINLVKECPACGRCYDRKDERCVDDDQELILSLPVERTIDGKYRLDRLIGRGGMGAVYLAEDLRLNRRVAIKVIKGSSFHSTTARRRFAREAQACAQLAHANIIRVYDYGAFENQSAYLVMEYVHGNSWRAELDRLVTFTPAATAELLDQVFDGMEAAHAAGILHRDLKPDNLMISNGTGGGRLHVKILDFGLAKVREGMFDEARSVSVAGVAMGTFGYMSPEQLAAHPVDERTDVYSLGVVALETLTGVLPPFGPNFHPVIEAEVNRRLLAPATTPAQVTLANAVARALSQKRTPRFGSITEMRAVLIPAIRGCADLPLATTGGTPTGSAGSRAPSGDEATRPGLNPPRQSTPTI